MTQIVSHRDLIVWQRSMLLVKKIYVLSNTLPNSEKYGLGSQLKRSAISIPSNISEGKARSTRKDYRHFVVMAYGSGAELDTQLEIAKQLSLVSYKDYEETYLLLVEVMKMLNVLIRKLN